MILSDGAHFYLDGFINQQYCSIRGSENPAVIVGNQMQPRHVTICLEFWVGFPRKLRSTDYNGSLSRHDISVLCASFISHS